MFEVRIGCFYFEWKLNVGKLFMKLVKVCFELCYFCFARNATILGMWHSGSASALHAEGQGSNPPSSPLSVNLRMVTCSTHVGCFLCTYSSVAERPIAVFFWNFAPSQQTFTLSAQHKTTTSIPILLNKTTHYDVFILILVFSILVQHIQRNNLPVFPWPWWPRSKDNTVTVTIL
jgi:hypothetical protein